MKKLILAIFLLYNISIFSQEKQFEEKDTQNTSLHTAPFIYLDPFQPGYGISIRSKTANYTFEIAPMFAPPSGGCFGSSEELSAITGSCYYSFRNNKIFRPYLGLSVSYHYRSDSMRYYTSISYIDGLLGFEISFPKNQKQRFYLFSDLVGFPFSYMNQTRVSANRIEKRFEEIYDIPFPRLGLGLYF